MHVNDISYLSSLCLTPTTAYRALNAPEGTLYQPTILRSYRDTYLLDSKMAVLELGYGRRKMRPTTTWKE